MQYTNTGGDAGTNAPDDMRTAAPDDNARATTCPQCGRTVPGGTRFVTWCESCDWNVDPQVEEPPPFGRVERLRRSLARRHGERLAAEMAGGSAVPPHGDAASLAAYALSLAVHSLTVLLAATGLGLIVLGWGIGFYPVLGALALLIAFVLRPRFGSLPADGPVLHRPDAPRLFELIDRVGAEVGTRGVDAVVVGPEVNAAVSTYGIRRRRVLHLGLGLWEPATVPQRIALLGHELGHYANGDVRHSHIVGITLDTLEGWVEILTPTPTQNELYHAEFIAWKVLEALGAALLAVPRAACLGLLMLLDVLTLRASQRAEYLADAAAAHVGSSEAAASGLDLLLVADAAEGELRRQAVVANSGPRRSGRRTAAAHAGLWERLTEWFEQVPEREYERLRRVSARRGHSVESTHPPTHLRRSLVAAGGLKAARIVPSDAHMADIGAELAAAREEVARRVIRDYVE
ncbi:M48 family metallopeptidase [Streptomyces sp. KLOTTS4A1]|uniref:M48 family metallopeptidase n=1 Tax=Streptomyces sp. KLOTTS4A1 TaxID=3390996 RepID=UPI0039F4E464